MRPKDPQVVLSMQRQDLAVEDDVPVALVETVEAIGDLAPALSNERLREVRERERCRTRGQLKREPAIVERPAETRERDLSRSCSTCN